ncbi:putative TAF11-like protein ENSP00000332601 [Tupaia chinensis]|uniref:putative TAF11-like protein ENSP00000332601 n=1 Tax=Tupaia chinensis TaxID=246437 RepID=UPI0003C8DEA2|nr:putative TAF11-like protein ENSP00000332601 [Tupaia chinensis]
MDTDGQAGASSAMPDTLWGPRATNVHGISEDQDWDLERPEDQEDELRSQDILAEDKEDSYLLPPATKKRKTDTKGTERRPAVDEEEVQKMTVLLASFSEEQMARYELCRRSAFPQALITTLLQSISGRLVSQKVAIAMAGMAKVFVGEVVEEALDVCRRLGEMPPLQPKHLREAARRLRSKGLILNTKYKKVMFF